ncbi:MAG: RNA 2',3'-cyclic phosphodiesterase [Deltaproteobacteria bacterium]|nr:RNA 2',3'-cyclic phosphodiesterase [Deltaproteobacteria bacterium]
MAHEKQLRAFLAAEIPPNVKNSIRRIQEQLAPLMQGIRWTKPEGIHLTLKFFGNISESDIPCISRAVEREAAVTVPVTLNAHSIGAFPGLSRPRVLWMGLEGDTDRLCKLHEAIDSDLQQCGFQKDVRLFNPHLTLGRAKTQRGIYSGIREIMAEKERYNAGQFEVSGITLFRSDLKPDGPLYTKLAYYQFNG